MPKIRKLHRKKRFRANVNRKRLKNKLKRPGKVRCDIVKQNWDKNKSVRRNMAEMGLLADPNENIKHSVLKEQLITEVEATTSTEREIEVNVTEGEGKKFVIEELEKEAKKPRLKRFMLPKNEVEWITNLLDKYGKNYKAMAKDKTNVYQKTWKQIRQQIRTFKKIPDQYGPYLRERGLTEEDENSDVFDSD